MENHICIHAIHGAGYSIYGVHLWLSNLYPSEKPCVKNLRIKGAKMITELVNA